KMRRDIKQVFLLTFVSLLSWTSQLFCLYLNRLRRVVAQDVNNFNNDGVLPWRFVGMGNLFLQVRFLTDAVALPLIMKGIGFVVPVHRPIVNPLAPMRDGFLNF